VSVSEDPTQPWSGVVPDSRVGWVTRYPSLPATRHKKSTYNILRGTIMLEESILGGIKNLSQSIEANLVWLNIATGAILLLTVCILSHLLFYFVVFLKTRKAKNNYKAKGVIGETLGKFSFFSILFGYDNFQKANGILEKKHIFLYLEILSIFIASYTAYIYHLQLKIFANFLSTAVKLVNQNNVDLMLSNYSHLWLPKLLATAMVVADRYIVGMFLLTMVLFLAIYFILIIISRYTVLFLVVRKKQKGGCEDVIDGN
jgi:hypothetical protein